MDEPSELPRTPAIEPLQQSRLLPRYTFRTVIGLTLLVAVFLAVARAANSGTVVAAAMVAAVVFLAACFVLFMLLFLFSWLVSIIWYQPDHEMLHGAMHSDRSLPPSNLVRSERV